MNDLVEDNEWSLSFLEHDVIQDQEDKTMHFILWTLDLWSLDQRILRRCHSITTNGDKLNLAIQDYGHGGNGFG